MLVPILGTLLSYKLVLVLMFILGDHAYVIAFTYLLDAQSAILWVSRSLVCVCQPIGLHSQDTINMVFIYSRAFLCKVINSFCSGYDLEVPYLSVIPRIRGKQYYQYKWYHVPLVVTIIPRIGGVAAFQILLLWISVLALAFLSTLNSSETLPLSHALIVDSISHSQFFTRMVDVLEIYTQGMVAWTLSLTTQ